MLVVNVAICVCTTVRLLNDDILTDTRSPCETHLMWYVSPGRLACSRIARMNMAWALFQGRFYRSSSSVVLKSTPMIWIGWCLLGVHWVFTVSSLGVYWVFTGCLLGAYEVFIGCSTPTISTLDKHLINTFCVFFVFLTLLCQRIQWPLVEAAMPNRA